MGETSFSHPTASSEVRKQALGTTEPMSGKASASASKYVTTGTEQLYLNGTQRA